MFSFTYYAIQILSRGHSLICIIVNKMKCHKKDLILVKRWVLDMLCCCSQSVLDNRNIPQTKLFACQVFTRDPALLRENRPKNDSSNLNPNSSAVGWREKGSWERSAIIEKGGEEGQCSDSGVALGDTQNDSIQSLNVGKNWFNSIFDSIMADQNSIQTIIQLKRLAAIFPKIHPIC